jgi:hypothetical protein
MSQLHNNVDIAFVCDLTMGDGAENADTEDAEFNLLVSAELSYCL